jgi:hypothetical protein
MMCVFPNLTYSAVSFPNARRLSKKSTASVFQQRNIITIKTKENLDNSVLGLLHRVVVGDIADVSDVLAASIFKVQVCRLVPP